MLNGETKKKHLKNRMKAVGLSYRKAEPLVGASFNYISDILNGRRDHYGHALCRRLDAVLKEMEAK